MRMLQALAAITIFAVCLIFRHWMEAHPATHALVLLPLLAISGWLAVMALGLDLDRIKRSVATAISLFVVFTILFWMLPRWIDASLVDPWTELAKFVSAPLLIGGGIALGWRRTHPLFRGFLKANAISMLGVMSFLYTHAPVRICNSYLVSEQEQLGFGFLFAAFGLSVLWSVPLFVAPAIPVDRLETPMKKVSA